MGHYRPISVFALDDWCYTVFTMADTVRLTSEEKKAFTDEGARLAILLGSSDMSDELKQSWAALVPYMTVEELDRFASLLESYAPGHSSDRVMIAQGLEKLAEQVTSRPA